MAAIWLGHVRGYRLKDFSLVMYSLGVCHSLNLSGVCAAECCLKVIPFFRAVQKQYNVFSISPLKLENCDRNCHPCTAYQVLIAELG